MRRNEFKKKRIGVIYGGTSAERRISIRTGRSVLRALKSLGYRAVGINADSNLADMLKRQRIEVVFNAMHGGGGENGSVQGLLEVLGIPYTGSGVLASGLGMNKLKAKEIFKARGIPTPDFYCIDRGALPQRNMLGFPAVVKPVSEGSSIGVRIVKNNKEFLNAVSSAFRYSGQVIVERYIRGKEITVGILNDLPLAAMEVVPKRKFLDYTAKYTPGMEEFIMPAPLPAKTYEKVLALAADAHQALCCSGYSRVDTRVSSSNTIYILEVNTLPGLTSLSYLPKISEWCGIGYDELVEKILLTASLKRG